MKVADSLRQVEEVNRTARGLGIRVRSYIATSFGCPMEGPQELSRIVDIAAALDDFGSYEISLGDTTGMADPESSYHVPLAVKEAIKHASLAVHYHQASGIEYANMLASLQAGITVFDGAAGGLGGCPYAPGATGNSATETIVDMFTRLGIATGIDVEAIKKCGQYARSLSSYCQ
jgi:hydroxymethylglutaryl-CoA lyase